MMNLGSPTVGGNLTLLVSLSDTSRRILVEDLILNSDMKDIIIHDITSAVRINIFVPVPLA